MGIADFGISTLHWFCCQAESLYRIFVVQISQQCVLSFMLSKKNDKIVILSFKKNYSTNKRIKNETTFSLDRNLYFTGNFQLKNDDDDVISKQP